MGKLVLRNLKCVMIMFSKIHLFCLDTRYVIVNRNKRIEYSGWRNTNLW